MDCDNIFCIYNEKRLCTLNNVTMGVMGECQDCMYITMLDEELDFFKERTKMLLEKSASNRLHRNEDDIN